MIYLADTNVLLRFADRRDPLHPVTRSAVRTLKQEAHQVCTFPQNCVEFWNVSTRPRQRDGLGIGPSDTDRLVRLIERVFPVLPDNALIYTTWRRLVVAFGVSGVQVHDARLVAAMLVHGITHILTFNVSDFVRYSSAGITAVDPTTI